MYYTVSVERNERCIVDIRVEAASPEDAAQQAEELVRADASLGDVRDSEISADVFGSIVADDGTWWI